MSASAKSSLAPHRYVEVDVDGPVAVIRMTRTEKANALDDELIGGLEAGLAWALAEEDLRVLILTGSERAFCSGGDISLFTVLNSESGYAHTKRGFDLLRPLETSEKPVIAAVEGYCIAGGVELALACDFIIAGEGAKIGFGEVDLGLIPGWGGTVRSARAIPARRARQMVMTCERIDAEEALRLSLVNEVVEKGAALNRALELAAVIASKPALAVRAAKMTIGEADDANTLEGALAVERSVCSALFGTDQVRTLAQEWIDKSSSGSR